MENNSDFVKVDKLQSPEDWQTWKFDIRVILRAAELMEYVTGVVTKPVQSEGQSDGDHTAALATFNKSDYKAQKVIVTALGRQPKLHVMNCDTSKEMWDTLLSVYEQSSKTSVH